MKCLLKAEPTQSQYFKKVDNMTKRIWMSLTVIVVWSISSLYFLSSSSDGETAQSFRTFIHSSTPAKRTLSVPKTRSSVWKPPPPPPRIKKHKRDTSQPLYVKMQNQDIFGRCDLGDEPVDFSQAETLCERDPLCKAFVEIDGQAYLKSCVNPDKGSKGGRTLYVYHTYYKDIRETPNPPNLRKSPKTNGNIYTSSSSSSSSSRSSAVHSLDAPIIRQFPSNVAPRSMTKLGVMIFPTRWLGACSSIALLARMFP